RFSRDWSSDVCSSDLPVRHHELVEYITRVAEASDRMTLEVIGHSHERRPILFVVVTSPENHARLAAIRERHVALSEPGSGQAVRSEERRVGEECRDRW